MDDFDQEKDLDSEIEAAQKLTQIFQTMKKDVDLLFFSDPTGSPEINDLVRQILRMIRQLTSKISLREFSLGHPMAHKYGITRAPTLLFSPEALNITWYGAPLGEEGRTFVELILLLGAEKREFSESFAKTIEGIKEPRSIKAFVSPTCPYCPQQVINAAKALLLKPDLFGLEIIDIQLHPDLAEKYKAFSVPQVWANDQLIALGAQSEELFAASLAKLEQQTFFIPEDTSEEVFTDLVIVGGGPAGLTAGIYGKRSGLETVIVEKSALGGQIATTPVVENYPGLTHVGGKTLVDILVNHALEYVRIYPEEEVRKIIPATSGEGRITVQTTRRKFLTKTVLLATGAEHRKLNIPGEAEFAGRGVSYCSTCDGPLFKGKNVLMVGGGNSAVTEALYLKNMGASVTLVHRRDSLRAQEHLVNLLKAAEIPILLNCEVKKIEGDKKVSTAILFNNKTKETTKKEIDGVFIAIGYDPAVSLAEIAGVELNENGYISRDERHRTSVPGIYSAGDVEGGYKQIVVAAGHGAEAAMTIFEDLIHPYWKSEK